MILRYASITLCIWIFAIVARTTDSAKILGVFAFPGKSHWMMLGTIMEELALRGHEVTVISNFPRKDKLQNYTDVPIVPNYDYWAKVQEGMDLSHLFEMNDLSMSDTLTMVHTIGFATTEYALQHPNVQKIIHSHDLHFDLVIVEQFYQEAFLMLAHKFQAPMVSLCTLGYIHHVNNLMGNIGPWSHVPNEYIPYDDQMTLMQRFKNARDTIYEDLRRIFHYMPQQEAMAQKYFSHLPGPLPKLPDLERNISVFLLNTHTPLSSVRPKVLGMVEVGGVHLKKPKPLPEKIKQFLDGAEHGAIFFSLGTNLRSSEMPPEKMKILMNVFSEMKQRILWKWEDDSLKNLPENVMISPWMPQTDILAHRNMKVFITHGGLFSTQEGVYRGVPLLGIPIYCDQHVNTNKAIKYGYGLAIKFPNITETSLKWAFNELLYNPTYANKMQETSRKFRDRPVSAIDEAMFWIDYVIRYRGARHIRSYALEMSWFAYFCIDILAICAFAILVAGICSWKILRIIIKLSGRETRNEDKLKKLK